MLLSEIRDEVRLIVQESADFTEKQLDDYINQASRHACGVVAIPDLKAIASVDTVIGQRYVNLYSIDNGFSGILRKALNSQGQELKVSPDLESFVTEFPVIETGSVAYCTLEGNNLWVHPVPDTEETLTLVLYNNPPTLQDSEDEVEEVPTWFPEYLHRKLLVNGTCYFIFDMIEDGIEGQKVNAMSHYYLSFNDTLYSGGVKSGIQELREYFGKRRNHFQSSVWRY